MPFTNIASTVKVINLWISLKSLGFRKYFFSTWIGFFSLLFPVFLIVEDQNYCLHWWYCKVLLSNWLKVFISLFVWTYNQLDYQQYLELWEPRYHSHQDILLNLILGISFKIIAEWLHHYKQLWVTPNTYVGHTITETGISIELELYNFRGVYYQIFDSVVGDMVNIFFKLLYQE